MIRLSSAFKSGALFLQRSCLTVKGHALPDRQVSGEIFSADAVVSSAVAHSNADGAFSFDLVTPGGSFTEYSIRVSDGTDELTIDNILFGELWFASGQSNMEMTNYFMPECNTFLAAQAGKNIRVYAQSWVADLPLDGKYPFDPCDDIDGSWVPISDAAAFAQVSACATAAVVGIYDYLNRRAPVPVGFLNVSVGATRLETWLSRDTVASDEFVSDILRRIGIYPDTEHFNSYGGDNFRQPCALYNLKVAPLIGVRTRGLLWYQGESNVGYPSGREFYVRELLLLQEQFSKEFGGDWAYPVLSSQIYPWVYSEDNCEFGELNSAFTDTARDYPDRFGAAAIYDLSPIWAAGLGNHPIHPANKYRVGARLGELALAHCYESGGLRSAVQFKRMRRHGDELIISFETGGRKLECGSDELRGFYICGESGTYVEAKAEICGRVGVRLSHPYIKKPLHAAYQYSCMEHSGRLFCGGMPVAPFGTDRSRIISIIPKPWLHTDTDAVFVLYSTSDDYSKIDSYNRPTWQPCPDSAICRDNVFTRSASALRIIAQDGQTTAGAYVVPYIANRLDMFNYKGMKFFLIRGKGAVCRLVFDLQISATETRSLTFTATKIRDVDSETEEYYVGFELPQVLASRMTLRFDLSACPVNAVNFDCPVLEVK